MARTYPKTLCANPDCKKQFEPHRRNQLYCTQQCRINFNNDKRRDKNLNDYKLEKELRRNERILKKIIASPCYKNDEIDGTFLVHEKFDFDISTDSNKNGKSGNIIRWCHKYGIELKNLQLKTFTVHKRDKIK